MDSLPDQWIVEHVHLGLAIDMGGIFIMYGWLYVLEVPNFPKLHSDVLCEVHAPRCVVCQDTVKMYHNVYISYWSPGLKRNVVDFVVKCLIC